MLARLYRGARRRAKTILWAGGETVFNIIFYKGFIRIIVVVGMLKVLKTPTTPLYSTLEEALAFSTIHC